MGDKLADKLSEVMESRTKLENRLKNTEQEIKSIKENMIMNSKFNIEVYFEEDSGEEYYTGLYYNVYIVRNKFKELILEHIYYDRFIKIDITNKYDYIPRRLSDNKILLKEEIDKILAECLGFREEVIIRKEQYYEEWRRAKERSMNCNMELQVSDEVKSLRKEFIIGGYKLLAKKYHPDTSSGDEDKFKVLSEFKDKLLEIYELN